MSSYLGPNITNDGLVLCLDAANDKSFRGEPTVNLVSSPTTEVTWGYEFMQYCDIAPIFDTYGTAVIYSLSVDLKSANTGVTNVINVYMQNGSYTKYSFVSQGVTVTTEYQRFKFENLTAAGPTALWLANTPDDNRAMLACYGTYGTGNNPIMKNVQIEIKNHCTPFVVGTRGTTVATGGGWKDLSNSNNGELCGITYNNSNLGNLVFTIPSYIPISSLSNYNFGSAITIFVWHKNIGGDYRGVINNEYGSGTGFDLRYGRENYYGGANNGTILNCAVRTSNGNYAVSVYAELNMWGCYAYTYNGSNVIAYKNGVPFGNPAAATGTLGTNSNIVVIGRNADGVEYLTGNLAYVQLYNRALSATEILQNYNATKSRYGL